MWKGKAILWSWALALILAGAGYQFGPQDDISTVAIWGVPVLLALVGSTLLVNWRSRGEATAQAIWIVIVISLSFATILSYRFPPLQPALAYGFVVWSLALTLGYIGTGAAVGWRQMIVAGCASLLFVAVMVAALFVPPLGQVQYLAFGVLHGCLLVFMALR